MLLIQIIKARLLLRVDAVLLELSELEFISTRDSESQVTQALSLNKVSRHALPLANQTSKHGTVTASMQPGKTSVLGHGLAKEYLRTRGCRNKEGIGPLRMVDPASQRRVLCKFLPILTSDTIIKVPHRAWLKAC